MMLWGYYFGVGYIAGCLLSVVLWNIDRQKIFLNINNRTRDKIKNKFLLQSAIIILLLLVIAVMKFIPENELYNCITAFLVIDISNTENKNLKLKDKINFYDSISAISCSLVCGFISPLIYIAVLGNSAAVVYMLIYNLSKANPDCSILEKILSIMNILPALFAELVLLIIYFFRNKFKKIDFKGDFIINCFSRPLLNADILAANIEAVNFYYYYNENNMKYIKSYGCYNKKIDELCIKDYLGISYSISIITFIIFFISMRMI